MDLTEWKQAALAEERERVKTALLENNETEVSLLSPETIEEIKEEIAIEMFREEIQFEGTFEIEDLIEDFDEVQEDFEFTPNEYGQRMDLEFEIDTDTFNPTYMTLGKIRDLLFAEDYDIEEADDRKAKVVFKRAGGKISKSKKCGPGMKLKGNRCIPQSGTEKAGERKKGIKLKRAKRAMGAGAKKKAAIKAKITKKRVAGRNRSYAGT